MNLTDLPANNERLRAENEQLRAENQQLRREKAALEERVARLEADWQALKALLETAQRQGKRQATPFSKGAPKAAPKKPGRKAGHPAAHRAIPEKIDRTEEAPWPPACPDCGGAVVEDQVQTHAEGSQIDVPRPIPVTVTQFNLHVGHCADCGQRLPGRHPDQTSDATGAAAVQIGPNALGLAAELKHGLGLPFGKVARILSTATEQDLSRATLARASQRLAQVSADLCALDRAPAAEPGGACRPAPGGGAGVKPAGRSVGTRPGCGCSPTMT